MAITVTPAVLHFTFSHGNHEGTLVATLTNAASSSTYATNGFTLSLAAIAPTLVGVSPNDFKYLLITSRAGYVMSVTLTAVATRTIATMATVKIYTSGGTETANATDFSNAVFDVFAIISPIKTN